MTRSRSPRPRQRRDAADAARQVPLVNADESPLAWLARRRDKEGQPLIAREQFEAGERLRRDFTFALLGPRVTASYSAVASDAASRRSAPGAASDLADNVVAARERVNRALSAVGPELSSILVDVCCHLKGLEASEKAAGWPQRSAKIVLTIALQQLARHYGLLHEARAAGPGAHRIRHWGAQGYRPSAETERETG